MSTTKTDKKSTAFYISKETNNDIDSIVHKTKRTDNVTRSAVITAAVAYVNEVLISGDNHQKNEMMNLILAVKSGG